MPQERLELNDVGAGLDGVGGEGVAGDLTMAPRALRRTEPLGLGAGDLTPVLAEPDPHQPGVRVPLLA